MSETTWAAAVSVVGGVAVGAILGWLLRGRRGARAVEDEPTPTHAVSFDPAYRDWLVKAHHDASEAYDKAIMTLAGGALAISLAFIKDVTPNPIHTNWVTWAWGLLAGSLLVILISFLTSQLGLLQAVKRFDANHPNPDKPWGARLTGLLNLVSCVTFVAGVSCLVRFALYNL